MAEVTETKAQLLGRPVLNGDAAILEDYQQFVSLLKNPDPHEPRYGMAGEVGEYVDMVKKTEFHGKGRDRAKLVEELGDIVFYVVAEAVNQGITFDEVISQNVLKLMSRYPDGFVKGGGNR